MPHTFLPSAIAESGWTALYLEAKRAASHTQKLTVEDVCEGLWRKSGLEASREDRSLLLMLH